MSTNEMEVIQVNIFGDDKPGLTTSFTDIIAKYKAQILDIGQANIHKSLTLAILLYTSSECSGQIMKELLFKASEQGVQVRFAPIDRGSYEAWVSRNGRTRYIVTVLGRQVSARDISDVTNVIFRYGLNIDAIKRLTGRPSLDFDPESSKYCIEFSIHGSLTSEQESNFHRDLMVYSGAGVDISFQRDDMYRRYRRLICFDMDSTLIHTEVIDELADRAGVGAQVRAITESAMRGEIDFIESFTRRVALLKGLDESVMKDIAEHLPYNEGLGRMMTMLKRMGYKTAILSGGFTYFGKYLQDKFGFDYVYANDLEIENGKLTGRYVGEVMDGRRKAAMLKYLCEKEDIDLAQTVAVGDGANDLPMLALAGLGIAYHAKPKVKATAEQSISTIGLDGILYFLGLQDRQIDPVAGQN